MEIERRLSKVLSEFARTLATDFPVQAILDRLVTRIVDVLPISAAGATLISHRHAPRHVAGSDEWAVQLEVLQTDLGEGPSLAAFATSQIVSVPDLKEGSAFPKFAQAALDEGLGAVLALPLCEGDTRFGALDLYCEAPGHLDAEAIAAARTLAEVTTAYLLNAQAHADLRCASERAHHISLRDPLTGLPNRSLVLQRLEHAIVRCRRTGVMAGVLYGNLDGFRWINDVHGHQVGDDLLVAVAGRLTAQLRSGDTLARLAADEFVILCEDLDDESQVEPIAARIDAALSEPFTLPGVEEEITASVGIAFASEGDELAERVLQAANTAMRQAKEQGGARHTVLDRPERDRADLRRRLNHDLRGAVGRGEMRAAYQPIVAGADGYVIGAEALLRWAHPVHGIVGPSNIVPLAEHSGLVGEIGRWILERACLDRHRWEHFGWGDLGVAVNVSALQLITRGFVDSVATILSTTDTDPTLVTLEVTETVFLQDSQRALVVLRSLKDLGVTLALDDFGTGYSSLAYLKEFPVDIVKIDRLFIADLEQNPTSRSIVRAVVDLAHGLGMEVVAEGVETEEQRRQIVELGCDYCQGFYFARPAFASDHDTLLGPRESSPNRRSQPAAVSS
jgi:diguanylate cyclase (GGDEF)-like protein